MAMEEHEFQESEVIFSENHEFDRRLDFRHQIHQIHQHNKKSNSKKNGSTISKSVPVNIPNNLFGQYGGGDDTDSDCGGDNYKEDMEWDEGEITPPHVILGRRVAGKMAFSVCSGNGRTLKGRDLSQVRNSILRMTGFLEA